MLKLIALITMIIDHIGASLFPNEILFRLIGRLSFPIFAFSLSEGYIHTKSKERYFKRLFMFSMVSLIPYILLFGGYKDIKSFLYVMRVAPLKAILSRLNIGFTFCISFISLRLIDKIRKDRKCVKNYIFLLIVFIISKVIGIDYSMYGVLAVMVFYIFRGNNKLIYISFMLIPLSLIGTYSLEVIVLQYIAILSLPIIFYLKDNKINKKIKLPKWIFYSVYPVHIILLWILK